jgi:SAM-dependent methyltransferase
VPGPAGAAKWLAAGRPGPLASASVTYQHPLAWLLGLEGLALLRAHAGDGYDADFARARIAEIRKLLDQAGPVLGEGRELGQLSTADGYRIWSADYDQPGNLLIEVEQPVVRRILDGLPPGAALDAACGTGRHARYLAARGHRVTGVDSSPDMLARARQNVAGATFCDGDLRRLPVRDQAMDLVVCGLALTHQPALRPVLAEFGRVLRPGGHLVTSDLHVLSMYLGGVPALAEPDGPAGLLPATRYLASDYLTAAGAAGFELVSCAEPRWPAEVEPGGPLARQWCPAAADAAYAGVPAAVIWHFRRAR